jgi:hypothetical protein
MKESQKEVPVSPIPWGLGVALTISMAATLYLGLLPGRILDYASRSVADLLH